MEKHIEYKCVIDSIQLRVDDIGIEKLFNEHYHTKIIDYSIIHRDLQTFRKLFSIKTITNSITKKQHQIINFSGFVKYDTQRDKLIDETFYKVVEILSGNDIKFYLNKIDLSIDFYSIEFEELNIKRNKYTSVQRKISNLDAKSLDKIKQNIETFYLEKNQSKKNSKQRLYVYNKTIKEQKKGNKNIFNNIYRVESELINFNNIKKEYDTNISKIELDKLSIEFDRRRGIIQQRDKFIQFEITKNFYKEEFVENLFNEIKNRFSKYHIICVDKEIYFDYSIVETVLPYCVNL